MRAAPFLLPALLLAGLLRPSGALADAPAPAGELAVAAASNLKAVLDELADRFEATHAGVRVRITYGASGRLAAQIGHGAPFDLYLSADREYPQAVADRGRAAGAPFVYAHGRLVIWVPGGSPLGPGTVTLAGLADPAVRRLAIANPKVAPYGRAAVAALKAAGVYARVEDRLVLGENVAQAAQFAERGAADAAILPLALARTPVMRSAGRHHPLPDGALFEQAGVVLRDARAPGLARAFATFLATPEARRVLVAHGYAVPEA